MGYEADYEADFGLVWGCLKVRQDVYKNEGKDKKFEEK